jgi:hypothetical protein
MAGDMAINAPADHDTVDHAHAPYGFRRWLFSTNHKDIGTMYLVLAIVAGLIGGFLSVVMRMELQEPGLQYFGDGHAFNVFVAGPVILSASRRARARPSPSSSPSCATVSCTTLRPRRTERTRRQ